MYGEFLHFLEKKNSFKLFEGDFKMNHLKNRNKRAKKRADPLSFSA
jgi:hypothetical protein